MNTVLAAASAALFAAASVEPAPAIEPETLSLAAAIVARVEEARAPHAFVIGPRCAPEFVAAFQVVRPVISERELQALAPPRGAGYFVVTSIRISTINPEWAWCEGRYVGGPGLMFSLSKDPECGWRAGSVTTTVFP